MHRILILWLLLAGIAAAKPRIEPVPNQRSLEVTYEKATDLSGITWMRRGHFTVVSNRLKALIPLRLDIHPETGAINEAHFGAHIPVKSKLTDFEGVAFQPEQRRLYVSTERPPGIIGFNEAGDASFAVEIPKIFQQARSNKALESLAFGAETFWTANEDALQSDGEVSSATRGALVRLQKFDARLRPTAQYAYRTDTSLIRASKSGTGITDLAVLPNGDLIVLERVVAAGLHARIYWVEFEGATDTSKLGTLSGDDVTPVKKTLLHDHAGLSLNFEGMALGPELADGWRSLILLTDSGGGFEHVLVPLRVRWE